MHDFEKSADAMIAAQGFSIDAVEVSVADYAVCVRAGACKLYTTAAAPISRLEDRNEESASCRGGRFDRANEAMNCVDWFEADAYCRWAGKRLPTLEEWKLAVGDKHPTHAAELHRSASEKGWFAGEWTSTPQDVKKDGPWPELRKLGSWRAGSPAPDRVWTLRNDWYAVSVRSPWIGFRCAR